jgi:sRNA-binding regulator protein Hfq
MNKDGLIGQEVILYLDGGHQLLGKVEKADEDRIFIKRNKEYFMVYKNKISAVLLNAEDRALKNSAPSAARISGERTSDLPIAPSRVDGGSEFGISIPLDMLTEEAQIEHNSDNFSVYFSRPELGGDGGGISFNVKEGGALDDTKE